MAGLAARCTACGTTFRVVPDQLRVAGGYVRCGRCSAVFNAAESLIDLDSLPAAAPAPAPAPFSPPPPPPAPAATPVAAAGFAAAADLDAWPLPAALDHAVAAPFEALEAPTAAAEPAVEWTAAADHRLPTQDSAAAVPDLADRPAFGHADAAAAATRGSADVQPEADKPASGTDFDLSFADPPPADEPEAPPQDLPADAVDAFELDLPHPDPSPGYALEVPPADEALEAATPPEPARVVEDISVDEARPQRIDYDPQAAAEPVSIEPTLPPPKPDAPPQQLSLRRAAAEEDLALRAEPSEQPSFVRRAELSQRWNAPPLRRRLAAGVVLGLLLLAGQAIYTWRNDIVAQWPDMRPIIEPTCAALGCLIEAPRALEALAIESSGLVRVEKSAVYKLQLALRNRSGQDVALPALELTLSDVQGKPLARRVMRAADFGVNATTLPAGREVTMQATLQAQFPGDVPVAGYTIDPFYP